MKSHARVYLVGQDRDDWYVKDRLFFLCWSGYFSCGNALRLIIFVAAVAIVVLVYYCLSSVSSIVVYRRRITTIITSTTVFSRSN